MKVMHKKTAALVGITLITLATLSMYRLPGDARFAAPHKSALEGLVGRISLNSSVSARLVNRILQISIPTVYAQGQCGNPPCDGTKSVPDYHNGVNGQPYCWFDGVNYSCAKKTCEFVGGSNLCYGPYQTKCNIPYHPDVYCNYSDKKSCQ